MCVCVCPRARARTEKVNFKKLPSNCRFFLRKGHIDNVLHIFPLQIVEQRGDERKQANALKLLFVLKRQNPHQAADFKAIGGYSLLTKVFTSARATVGVYLLKVGQFQSQKFVTNEGERIMKVNARSGHENSAIFRELAKTLFETCVECELFSLLAF